MSLFPVDAADEPKTWTNLAQSSTSCWILIEGVPRASQDLTRFTASQLWPGHAGVRLQFSSLWGWQLPLQRSERWHLEDEPLGPVVRSVRWCGAASFQLQPPCDTAQHPTTGFSWAEPWLLDHTVLYRRLASPGSSAWLYSTGFLNDFSLKRLMLPLTCWSAKHS